MYSSITNKMQRYTMIFIIINALHVSDGSSAHHLEIKTVYTASGICRAFPVSYRYREWVGTHFQLHLRWQRQSMCFVSSPITLSLYAGDSHRSSPFKILPAKKQLLSKDRETCPKAPTNQVFRGISAVGLNVTFSLAKANNTESQNVYNNITQRLCLDIKVKFAL